MIPISPLALLALTNTDDAYLVRDAGSFIKGQSRDKNDIEGAKANKEFLLGLRWFEVTDTVRNDGMGYASCQYFAAVLPDTIEAYEAIAEWSSLSGVQQDNVEVRRSPHASGKTGHLNELISKDVLPRRTYKVSMAVGHARDPNAPADEEPKVYFWAPGKFTKFTIISDDMGADKTLIPAHATVKLEG